MAAEEATGSGATVTLVADARPFEQALEKAAADSKTWGRRIADNLATMNLMEAGGRFESFKSQIESLGKMGVGDIGQKLGGGLGAGLGQAAGMAFGGPFGAMIGNFVGGTIGEQVGRPLAEGIGDALTSDGLARDAAIAGGRIGDALTSDWGDVWDSSLEELWAKAEQKTAAAWEEIQGLILKSLFRVTEGIDSLWGMVQKPFVAVINWSQEIAVKLGLVEAGTGKWGDALLLVDDVGRTVVGSIGYGLGFLEGLFIKLGGVIAKHLIAPLTTGLGSALQVASAALTALLSDPTVAAALAAAGVDLSGLPGDLAKVGNALSAAGQGVGVWGDQAAAVNPFDKGEAGRRRMLDLVDQGERLVAADKPPPPPPPPPVPLETVKAVLADSREAANIRARSGGPQDAQLRALDRVAKNGDEQVQQQKDMIGLLRDIGRHLEDAQVVRPY